MDTEKKMIPCGYRLCSITFPERGNKKFCHDKHRVAEYNLEHPRVDVKKLSNGQSEVHVRLSPGTNTVKHGLYKVPDEQTKKREGMKQAADHNPLMLGVFRRIALEEAFTKGTITIDDVRAGAEKRGIDFSSGNWIGSVFTKNGGWRWTGEVKASTHAGSHGRMVKKWMLRE